MDLWPLITDDLIEGAQSIERQLRPGVVARAIDSESVADARDAISAACSDWAGGASPLIAVSSEQSEIDQQQRKLLIESNVDGIDGRSVLSVEMSDALSDIRSGPTQSLLRQLIEVPEISNLRILTARGIPENDPWYIAYLGVLGTLPEAPDRERNRYNNLKIDLKFDDVVNIEGVDNPSIHDLSARVSDPASTSAVSLTRQRLPSGMVAGFNKGLPSTSRFTWGELPERTTFGPNIIVVYEPGSVSDLALLWNIRARFAHPKKLPLAVPLTEDVLGNLVYLEHQSSVHHLFGFTHNIAITSASVPMTRLQDLAEATSFQVVAPEQLVGPIYGYCVTSTDIAQFDNGEATVASFTPTDVEFLGQQYLASSDATWLRGTTIVSKDRLPPSTTMRRSKYARHGYLHGQLSTVGRLNGFSSISHPSRLEVLHALASDRSLILRLSEPGVAGEHLVRATSGDLSMLAAPGVVELMSNLTRRGHSSLVKRRLDQFLAGAAELNDADKYEKLSARLDEAIGSTELEETTYMNFNRMKGHLRTSKNETSAWIRWALAHRIILRGIEVSCPSCNHTAWRTLEDTVPALICHGCGREVQDPFDTTKIDHQYRASETLLRANQSDALPALLAMRQLAQVLGRRDGSLFGVYPGVELFERGSPNPFCEIDVLAVLGNGEWIVGECKVRARGLHAMDLDKLWRIADRVGAPATFAVTTDKAVDCTDPWKIDADSNGRPHFSLTAEHLFDLHDAGPAYGEEYFAWRDAYPAPAGQDPEAWIDKRFGEYLLHRSGDTSKWHRAPWDVSTTT